MNSETRKRKHVMTLFRQAKNMRLQDLKEITGHGIGNLSEFERGFKMPSTNTILSVAKGLQINPDILLYSFGYLPDKEKSIIMSDPFYYMDKVKRICNNTRRQIITDKEINDINTMNVLEYIVKGLNDDTGD